MNNQQGMDELANLRYDLPAGLVVFLVSLPMCLGIALASGAPLYAGIVAGVLGSLLVPLIGKSYLSITGPAAGLTTLVLFGIRDVGSFEAFLPAVMIGGVVQIILFFMKAGSIAYFLPSSVIRGMLAAIGIMLILKQIPHAVGFDFEAFGVDGFIVDDRENTFTIFFESLTHIETGAVIIAILSLLILTFWDISGLKKFYLLPAALVVVLVGIGCNELFKVHMPSYVLLDTHLVQLPPVRGVSDFFGHLITPDFNAFMLRDVWLLGITLGIIASLETLLTIEAIDRLDPKKRNTPLNRELLAQGVTNLVGGLLGALPMTAVIIRSTANVSTGGRTKMTSLSSSLFLFVSVLFISQWLNLIPLASLATILLFVGYKLVRPSIFIEIYKEGNQQFIPFTITIIAVLFTNLLIGVLIGLIVGIYYAIRGSFKNAIGVSRFDDRFKIIFHKDATFFHKILLMDLLSRVPSDSTVEIHVADEIYLDADILQTLQKFEEQADVRKIKVVYTGRGKSALIRSF